MTPCPGNHAANSLSTINQTRDIRSVEVNSIVAMIIWVIECVANLNISLVALCPIDRLTKLSIIIAWYYVIIPFTFLINTSYNKERIVENGWKMVLRSPFVKIHYYFSQPTSFELTKRLGKGPKTEKENVAIGKNKTIKTSKVKSTFKVSPSIENSDIKNEERVFIISNKQLDKVQSKAESVLEVEDLEVAPSTSMNKNNIVSQSQLNRLHANSSSSDSEPKNYTKSYRLKIGEDILRIMVEHTNDENSYLHYFHQLLEFEDMLKNTPLDQINDFEITPILTHHNRNVSKVKNSISQIRQSEKTKTRKTSHSSMNESFARESQITALNENNDRTFLLEIKNQLRCDTLKNFEVYCEDETKYDIFLKLLIDVEEEIIERVERQ